MSYRSIRAAYYDDDYYYENNGGAVPGAIVGGATGATIGGIAGGRRGALIGGVTGTFLGGAIGATSQPRMRDPYRELDDLYARRDRLEELLQRKTSGRGKEHVQRQIDLLNDRISKHRARFGIGGRP